MLFSFVINIFLAKRNSSCRTQLEYHLTLESHFWRLSVLVLLLNHSSYIIWNGLRIRLDCVFIFLSSHKIISSLRPETLLDSLCDSERFYCLCTNSLNWEWGQQINHGISWTSCKGLNKRIPEHYQYLNWNDYFSIGCICLYAERCLYLLVSFWAKQFLTCGIRLKGKPPCRAHHIVNVPDKC